MANIWSDDYRPYGTNKGKRGNPQQWRTAFEETMSLNEANEVIQDNSPWAILFVSRDANFEAVKKAFRKMCFKTHPDYGGTNAEFRKVNAAYSILKDFFGIS